MADVEDVLFTAFSHPSFDHFTSIHQAQALEACATSLSQGVGGCRVRECRGLPGIRVHRDSTLASVVTVAWARARARAGADGHVDGDTLGGHPAPYSPLYLAVPRVDSGRES